jgi:hypothetical protein
MLYWILLFISAVISYLTAIPMNAPSSGVLIFAGINFTALVLLSTLIVSLASLILPDGPKEQKDVYYYPIIAIKDDVLAYETEKNQTFFLRMDETMIKKNDAVDKPYLERRTYRQGGFKGHWLFDLNNYPDLYTLHLK